MTIFCPSPTVTTPIPAAWWDAADPDKRTLNGGNISALLDKSGNGVNATQGTAANQPALNVNGQATGIDTMKGDGVNDYMLCTVNTGAAFTVFLFSDREVAYNPSYIMGGDEGVGGSPAFLQNINFGGVQAFEFYYEGVGGGAFRDSFSTSATGFHVCALTHDDALGTPNTVGYFDGVQVFTGDMDVTSGRKFDHIYTNFTLGGFGDNNFSAFAFYNSVLPTYQIQSLSKGYFLSNRGLV